MSPAKNRNIQRKNQGGNALTKGINLQNSSMENVRLSEDIQIPRVMLLQAGSDAIGQGNQPGNFYNKVSGEQMETLLFIPMYMFKQRIYFENEEIACRSDNSLISSYGLYAGQRCDQCELPRL